MNKWQHLVTRRLAVQVAIAWNHGFGSFFKRRYGTGIVNTLVYFDGKKTDYYVEEGELKKFNKDLDKLLDNPEFVAGMIPEAKEFLEETYLKIKDRIKGAGKLSNKELAELYSDFSQLHSDFYSRMWAVFRICERIVLKMESKAGKLKMVFSTPLKPNDVTNERIELLKIAKRKWFNGGDLRKHARKFRHIPMFDFDHEPYGVEHFKKELSAVRNPEKELNRIKDSFKQRRKEFELELKRLNPDKELYNLIIMLRKAVFLRDYRDMIRQKLNLSIKKFYRVIGSRIGLNVKEIALLTDKEIEEHLLKSRMFDKKEVEERKKSFLLIQSGDKIKIYSGKDAKNPKIGIKETKTLKGIIASPGNKKGIVKIVYTNKDFDKFKKGDIMVTAMTRQDFVPVMRKASAIITNEGGITSHAAIICRELGLPCVVGAKNATEILKDGDYVEIEDGEIKLHR